MVTFAHAVDEQAASRPRATTSTAATLATGSARGVAICERQVLQVYIATGDEE